MSRPLEGYRPMPENEQQNSDESTEQEPAEVEETEDTGAETEGEHDDSDGDDGGEQPKEAAKPKEPEFDAKRAQDKIRKTNSENANLRKRNKELEKRNKEYEDAQKTEEERKQERIEAAEKRAATFRARAVKAEVRALAAPSFADPTDPEALLDLSVYVDDDGEIDTDRIEADLAELLERKPHLGKPTKPEPERKRPAPDRTQASSANGKRASIDPAEEFAGIIQSRLGRR